MAAAIRSIEASSSAEVVVEVRSRSGSYAHADGRFAALAAFAALLFMLFSPWTFDPPWVAAGAVASYGLGYVISRSSNITRRAMTTAREREQNVRVTAAATFVERGVAKTQRASGILLYLSVLERRIEIIADRGVLDAVPVLEWNQLVQTTRARRCDVTAFLEILNSLQPLLARSVPETADDRDELSNEMRFTNE